MDKGGVSTEVQFYFCYKCICKGRFGKLFRRQEASGWDQEAVDFVCLLHGVLGPSKEVGILWFEHLLQVLLSVNSFRLQHFPVNV